MRRPEPHLHAQRPNPRACGLHRNFVSPPPPAVAPAQAGSTFIFAYAVSLVVLCGGELSPSPTSTSKHGRTMAGLGNDPVQVFSTLRDLHWVKFTFDTGFELPSFNWFSNKKRKFLFSRKRRLKLRLKLF
jgi:hypothetical protein